ncbi:hypothetical protein RUM44_008720 [Polyplax serrata]|uniref:Protein kinase domain-containing protein n=1 Tax=Polyplax serrata TaxID=468196 RepID=A0ABR1BD08_POLSC
METYLATGFLAFDPVESNDPQKFRDIATVFHEIIMEAPDHLKSPCRKISSGELKILERFLSHDMRMPNVALINPRTGRNRPTGENPEWRIPMPRVPHTRVHPWLEHSTVV